MAAVRRPAAAGRLYPARPADLACVVDQLLAGGAPRPDRPKALVVPHGSYTVSGQVAAAAYRLLGDAPVRRVILLGPSHYVPLHGIALTSAQGFVTPLGEVQVDRAAQARVADLIQVRRREDAHRDEHSLEVQLPFLQRLLGDFALVPLLVGQATAEEVAEVLDALDDGQDTLIVVSSDLSHDHSDPVARALDAAASAHIESLSELGHQDACGRSAINGLLLHAKTRGLHPHTLALGNSGDDSGDRAKVVGYGAYAFTH